MEALEAVCFVLKDVIVHDGLGLFGDPSSQSIAQSKVVGRKDAGGEQPRVFCACGANGQRAEHEDG